MDTAVGWPGRGGRSARSARSSYLFGQFALAWLLAAPPREVVAHGQPGGDASCPSDMVLVTGDHVEKVTYNVCSTVKWGTCVGFERGNISVSGGHVPVRACMDVYEAPNVKGVRPYLMKSGEEGAAWCKERGKRLCSEFEWETACETDDHAPFGYGWQADETCNTQKPWRQFNAWVLMNGGPAADAELERLWQGDLSGARTTCVTRHGVRDLLGNAEEWVTPNRRYPPGRPLVLMGGHWAKPWQQCRMTNWAHESTFRFYEVGFRCCKEPSAQR